MTPPPNRSQEQPAAPAPLLQVKGLSVRFPIARGLLQKPLLLDAVRNIDLQLGHGETLSVVGESGSGKSTLARAILQLIKPTAGWVQLGETELTALSKSALRQNRRRMQMVFQDPISSLSPRRTVFQTLEEPLRLHLPALSAAQRDAKIGELMERMGLRADMKNRYPHEFSGGQAQRVGIARALILEPELLVADEPVSALDVSIQAQVLNLLSDIKAGRNFAMLFISHDLSVVRHVSDRLLVLYRGRIMETGDSERIYRDPKHPYTQLLIRSAPTLERRAPSLAEPSPAEKRSGKGQDKGQSGKVESTPEAKPSSQRQAATPAGGCPFHDRCPLATPECRAEEPLLRSLAGRMLACHHAT
jgi:ABC-type oligopeptide transport system ATPase subunit